MKQAKPNLERYNYKDLVDLRSEYLDSGFRDDHYEIETIDLGANHITATLNFTKYYMPMDEKFHLSVLWATTVCMQLAILYSCLSNNVKKEKEVYLRELNWKCKKPVSASKNLKITIHNITQKRRDNRLYYSASISVDDDKFTGSGSWIFDLS